MNPRIPIEEQRALATNSQTDVPEREWLAQCGFTAEESVALLWLRQWYQAGGSDRLRLCATGSSSSTWSSLASWKCKLELINNALRRRA